MKVSSDKHWLFKAEKAVARAYLFELQQNKSSWSGERDGKLHLDIDSREEIKCELIKPHIEGYDEYCKANGIDDESVIMPFEEKAEEMMRIVEQRVINLVIEVVDEQLNLS